MSDPFPTPGSELASFLSLSEYLARERFGEPQSPRELDSYIGSHLGWLNWSSEGKLIGLRYGANTARPVGARIGLFGADASGDLRRAFAELGAPAPSAPPNILAVETSTRTVRLAYVPGPVPVTTIGYEMGTGHRGPWALVTVEQGPLKEWEAISKRADPRGGTAFRTGPEIDYLNPEGWWMLPGGTLDMERLFERDYLEAIIDPNEMGLTQYLPPDDEAQAG